MYMAPGGSGRRPPGLMNGKKPHKSLTIRTVFATFAQVAL
jgi:hypothetical protein